MSRYFGTDGIRGPADGPLFGKEFLHRLSGAIIGFIRTDHGVKAPRIVIGRDTRKSGERILEDLVGGFARFPGNASIWESSPPRRWPGSPGRRKPISESSSRPPTIRRATTASNCFRGRASNSKGSTRNGSRLSCWTPPLVPREAHPDFSLVRRPARAEYLRSVEVLSKHLSLGGQMIVCDTANGATCETTPASPSGLRGRSDRANRRT